MRTEQQRIHERELYSRRKEKEKLAISQELVMLVISEFARGKTQEDIAKQIYHSYRVLRRPHDEE